MKIASVGFHFNTQEIGGASVPAVAFYQWLKEFGYFNAELLSFDYYRANQFQNIKDLRHCGPEIFAEKLNKFDFIYFCSPGFFVQKQKERPTLDWESITKPFVVHIHGECDVELYGEENIKHILSHPMCKALVTVDYMQKFWRQFRDDLPELYYYPCTLPAYLIKEETPFINTNRKGIAYAARIANAKNFGALVDLAKRDDFFKLVDGAVHFYGTPMPHKVQEHRLKLDEADDRIVVEDRIFDTYQITARKTMLSNYKYFWDAAQRISMRRFNLSAYEAMGSGCIPIANFNAIPQWAQSFAIHYDPQQPDVEFLLAQLKDYSNNFNYFQNVMKNCILLNSASYIAVKKQVKRILRYAH